jgi:hypothetical protein
VNNGLPCGAFLELFNHAIKIRIAGAEASGEPVATAFSDSFTIGKHFKLTGAARRNHGINAETLLDEGHETRDLGFVIPSSRARAYFDFHAVPPNRGYSSSMLNRRDPG